MPRFDPIRILAQADAVLADHSQASASGRLDDSKVRDDFRQRLKEADDELALTREFYERMTPSLMKFAATFAFGVGGLVSMPATLGWSMIVTLGSAGLALNDTRDFVDNREQIRRIDRKRMRIRKVVATL